MPKYLLDTNVCILVRDLRRGLQRRDPQAAPGMARLSARMADVDLADLAMSVISMGELRYGAEKSANPARNHALLNDLKALITVALLSEEVCTHYGALRCQLESTGQPIGVNDLWIAAHGLADAMTVVTNNTREFARVPNLSLEDWTA